ncbi:MAG: PhzF family phenazine biosynthesis isomerase [Alphaproteobacteria bacterium]|nr:PhzF family phenazine biosynthesis isomerase [Alphaproteobacteria bacterium]
MKLEFVTVDVFTDRQFGGNPLAVVVDGAGLSDAQMQTIAAEFNLSETTFVLPPQNADHSAQVRIFTPRAELPFAGHPNVGTAFVLAQRLAQDSSSPEVDHLMFEEAAGLVRMELLRERGAVVGARLASPMPFEMGDEVPVDIIADACGLSVDDIETENHPPLIASCGVPFVIAEVKDCEVLATAKPRAHIFERHLPPNRMTGIHLHARAILQEVDIQSRMFAPLHGINEDPATGSANVALIGLLAHLQDDPNEMMERRIGQGYALGRPSILNAAAEIKDDGTIATYIGGTCVPVMRGTLEIV